MARAVAKLPLWLPSGEAVTRVARHLRCAPEDAELRIVGAGKDGRVKARGMTVEGWLASPLAAAWRGARGLMTSQFSDEITDLVLRPDDLIAAGLLPGRPEGRIGWWAAQTFVWIIRRELGEWTPEMGREIRPAQLELSMAIAAGRINLWGRRPGSSQFEQIANDLFSLSKFKVVVTPHGDLSTEPPRKRHAFEEEYKDDCKWHDIKFDEDEIRREWLPAGCAEAKPEPPVEPPQSPPTEPALSPSEPSAGAAPLAVTSASAVVSPPKIPREDWLDQYLTKERQKDLATRHNGVTSATKEIMNS